MPVCQELEYALSLGVEYEWSIGPQQQIHRQHKHSSAQDAANPFAGVLRRSYPGIFCSGRIERCRTLRVTEMIAVIQYLCEKSEKKYVVLSLKSQEALTSKSKITYTL